MKSPTSERASRLLASNRGFTLMEVLVATAITGIAIGVCMAIFAQGHSQAFRGSQVKTAYGIAVRLLDTWKSLKKYPSSESGQVEANPGWSYVVESAPVSARITTPDGETRVVESDELTAITLKIIPPDKKRSFSLTLWVPSKEVEGS